MPKPHRTAWAEPGFLDLWAQAPALRHVYPVPRPAHRPRPRPAPHPDGERRHEGDRRIHGKRRQK